MKSETMQDRELERLRGLVGEMTTWYDEAMAESSKAGYACDSVAQTIRALATERDVYKARVAELEGRPAPIDTDDLI